MIYSFIEFYLCRDRISIEIYGSVEKYLNTKISGLVYNIRMKKYKERGDQIEKDLPVLDSLYRRLGELSLKNWLKEKIK